MNLDDAKLTDGEVYESPLVNRRQVADAATAKALWWVVEWLRGHEEAEESVSHFDLIRILQAGDMLTQINVPISANTLVNGQNIVTNG